MNEETNSKIKSFFNLRNILLLVIIVIALATVPGVVFIALDQANQAAFISTIVLFSVLMAVLLAVIILDIVRILKKKKETKK